MIPKVGFLEQTKLFMRLETAEMNIFISFFIIFSIFERTVMCRHVTSHVDMCRHCDNPMSITVHIQML
jgi:hypothetical protein